MASCEVEDVAAARLKVILFTPGVPEIIQQVPLPCWSSFDTQDKTVDAGTTFGTDTVIVLTGLAVILLTVNVLEIVIG